MSTSPQTETPGALALVYRYTIAGYSAQAPGVVIVTSDGVEAVGPNSQQIQGNVASSAADSGNPVKVGGLYLAALPTYASGQRGNISITAKGAVFTTAIDVNGNVGTFSDQAGDAAPINIISPTTAAFNRVFNGTSWDRARGDTSGSYVVSVPSAATPGVVQFSAMSAASDNAQVLKAARGKVYGFQIFNTTASAKYVRLYNKGTAPVAGDTPVRRIMVPANGVASYHVGQGLDGFTNGIGLRATGAPADADATVLAAGDLIFNIDYL